MREVRRDRHWWRSRNGSGLVAGAPGTFFRLTGKGASIVDAIESDGVAGESPLVDRLVAAGAVHPVPGVAVPDDQMTVVIPVHARDSAATALTDTRSIFVQAANSATAPTITSALADVNYTAETATTPVARATIAVPVNDPQGSTGVVVTTTNDNPALINGISVAGTYPNFTLAITTKTGITGTAVVTVKVADGGGNFTTKSFKVTVTPSPYTLSVETQAGRTEIGRAHV